MKKIMKIIKNLLLVLAMIYVVVCAAIYLYPQMFFYNPTNKASNLNNANVNGYHATRIDYKSDDGTPLYAWYTKPTTKKEVIIFMHGNSYNIETFYHKMIPLMEAGYGTFMGEYRGFGDVDGKITEKNLTDDAIAAVNELHKLGFKNEDIIVYGMSLGSHMATNSVYKLGQENHFNALILEVPFDSLLHTAKLSIPVYIPFDYLMNDVYDNYSIINKINTRLLVLGGSDDPTIPIKLAERLFDKANSPKEMIIYQGGKHSDLYNFRNYRDILDWLDKK